MSLLPQLPPTFEAALRDVRASSRTARVAAAERLKTADESQLDQALDALFVLFEDPLPIVRAAAAEALGELGDARGVPRLRQKLKEHDPRVRELATIAIGQIGIGTAQAALAEALESPFPEVRFQALAGYVESEGAAEPERVLALLDDSDREVRGQAARALAQLGKARIDDASRLRLRAALEDAADSVRIEAALALARLEDASGARELERALDQPATRHEALDAAARVNLSALREPIARIATNWLVAPADRVAAAEALYRLGDPRGTALLRAALSSLRSALRIFAAHAVAELSLVELVPDLVALAKRGGLSAQAAVDALARLAQLSEAEGSAGQALESLCRQPGKLGELAAEARKGPGIPPA